MQLQSHSGLASVNRICGFGLTATRIFFCRDRDVRVDLLRQFQVIAQRLNAFCNSFGLIVADRTRAPLAHSRYVKLLAKIF